MKQLILVSLLGLVNALYAQTNYTISCTATDQEMNPIPYAILQLKWNDEILHYGEIKDGFIKWNNVPGGEYILECTGLGYGKFTKHITLDKDLQLSILLYEDVTQLEAVTVTAAENSLEYKNGTIKLHVAKSNLADVANVTDVIAKLPGIIISPDRESFSVLGKGNPVLYLNNQRISMEQFKSIPVNTIESIELLRNPSAKYEADGNVVIVVTLKKEMEKGYRIQLSEYASMQHHFNNEFKANSYLGFDKLQLQLSLGYHQLEHWESHTSLFSYEGYENDYLTLAKGPRRQIPGSIGFSYSLNETDYISTQTNFMIHRDRIPIHTQTTLFENAAKTYYTNSTNSKEIRDFISTNINYVKYFSPKVELFSGLQYTFRNRNTDNQIYNITNASNNELEEINVQGTEATVITGKADVSVQFQEQFHWESGVNVYHAITASNAKKLTTTSPEYTYNEQTYAAYSQLQGELGIFSFTTGLRLENNKVEGSYANSNEKVVNRNNTYLFPRVNASVKLDSLHTVTVNYARSISRPSFQQANNMRVYINPYLDFVNRINLTSALTNEVSIAYQYKKYTLNAGWYRNSNSIYYLASFNSELDKLEVGPTNVAYEDGYQLTLTIPFTYRIWNSTNYFYGGLIDVKDVSFEGFGSTPFFYFYTNNEIRLPKECSIGATYFYMSAHEEGVRTSDGYSAFGLSVSKTFDAHWKASVYVNDIFRTLEFTQDNHSNGIESTTTYFTDNRSLSLTLTYTFGSLTKGSIRNKNVDQQLDRVQ